METNLYEAAVEFIKREERVSHPAGSFDKAKRWTPGKSEECSCCESLRGPSRSFPDSLNKHCRTIAHVANLYNVQKLELKRTIDVLKKYMTKSNTAAKNLTISIFDVMKMEENIESALPLISNVSVRENTRAF